MNQEQPSRAQMTRKDGADGDPGEPAQPRRVRKTFDLRADEAEALRTASLRSGRSIPELVREAIRRFLGLDRRDQR